ncbi:hypothetical protein ACHAXT_011952 [Thalassiosira profunda]
MRPFPWLMALGLFRFGAAFSTATGSSNIATRNHNLVSPDQRAEGSLESTEWRQYCPGCRRPLPQCLCDHLPASRIRLDTDVLVLQHPVEFRRKTISTVPLLKLVLEQCRVMVGRSFDVELEGILDEACSEGRVPLVLFPGPNAVTLEDADAMEKISHDVEVQSSSGQQSKYLLIIVDGTWTQAKRMLRNSPALLERCQAVQFTGTNERSMYDSIRKQPDTHCLSTLESCERTLRLLEPNNPQVEEASRHLLVSLRAMILTQMRYERRHLEENPELVRNVSKLRAKAERQQQLLNSTGEVDATLNERVLPKEYTLRPLTESDATYVDSRWPYQSKKSLVMIQKQIVADTSNATKFGRSTCLGVESDGQLVACIIRHRNGSIGILHVDEEHRRFGLGGLLLQEAMDALMSRGEDTFAFIVDGNKASEALFSKLGWEKANPLGKKGTGKRRAKRLWLYRMK